MLTVRARVWRWFGVSSLGLLCLAESVIGSRIVMRFFLYGCDKGDPGGGGGFAFGMLALTVTAIVLPAAGLLHARLDGAMRRRDAAVDARIAAALAAALVLPSICWLITRGLAFLWPECR